MDAATIGILGRDYAAALLAENKAARALREAESAHRAAAAIEQRARARLVGAVKEHVDAE